MGGNRSDLSAQDAGKPVMPQGLEPAGTGTVGPRRDRLPPLVVELLKQLLLGAAYWGAAELSLRVALVERNVTPVWPPTGIAVVAFLLLGPRMWPAILAAAFVVNAPISDTVVEALAIAAGNTLAPLLALFLLRRVGFRTQLDRLRDAMAIVFLGALVGMLVSATIGTTALVLSGTVPSADYWGTWAVWWAGDAMGVLVVAPFLLSLRNRPSVEFGSWLRWAEAVALFVALAAVSYAVFRSPIHIQYLVFPFLGWAAWRFELRGAAPAALLASGIAVWAAVRGYGPFEEGSLFQKMVTLQLFNAAIAFTSFVLAALVTERRRARAALERSAVELEERVRQRTAELSEANDRLQQEILERRRAESDLRKTGSRLAEAQQIAHIGSWEWDIPADAITWSEELFRIFGVAPRDFDGTYDAFLRLVHPDDRDHADQVVRQALQDWAPFTFDHRTVRPDGQERIIRSRGEVVVDGSGTPIRMVGTGQDITEQQRAEDALKRFIANASHELRTPLTTVWGYAEALAQNGRDLPPDVFDEFLATLGREGERARHLLDNLLDLSRAEQAHTVGHPKPVALAEATRRVIQTITPPEGTSVEILAAEDIVVLADEESFDRVLINLLTNAYKYGGPHVRIEGRSRDGEVRIVVADDGPGVPPETLPALFEPFTRGLGAPGTGSGLGLAIARALVESFEGEMHYEPGVPSGARFVMTLPGPGDQPEASA